MEAKNNQVVVVDIRMPFWSMVVFMVKWSIAAIPSIIILFFIFSLFFMIMGGLLGGFNEGTWAGIMVGVVDDRIRSGCFGWS